MIFFFSFLFFYKTKKLGIVFLARCAILVKSKVNTVILQDLPVLIMALFSGGEDLQINTKSITQPKYYIISEFLI